MPRANPGQISTSTVALPPLDEQLSIAKFLDRETGKIDALVAKKEELIKLLEEQRTALITHAVTKGLDPTVPMKDSGVVGIGVVPNPWRMQRLRNSCEQIFLGLTSRVDYVSSPGFPLVRALNITSGSLETRGVVIGSAFTSQFAMILANRTHTQLKRKQSQ